MKIAVMAGTPVDTNLGAELLKKHGYNNLVAIPISKNPIEQTTFQAMKKIEKEKIIIGYIKKLKIQNCTKIFVYCNSLSSAINFDELSKKYNVTIITPMQMYRTLGLEYRNLAVITANSHGLVGVENNLYVANPELKILGITMLELVKAIEEKQKPDEIVTKFNFIHLLNYFEQMQVEAIVLGCTHFPYIKNELKKITSLPIIDVGLYMVKKLKINTSKK
ncbi:MULTISPECIES: aspartate/glutamate racemase family protein [Gemella]|uniref:aspartate/glutamate racemase family protein n=1 Tax=Gemella TaxID=1378 RepID=UPI0007680E46|nr:MULTISPECIES: aspartate/glutamate racemase family protein [Gemella]AME09465.1 glutamate racemase [Gemella sp. oral taxon 928]AXI27105.1 glutamate racemase [Gemella sp. ND 6198]